MRKQFIFCAALLLLGLEVAGAQIPGTMGYQGVLTDQDGKPLPDGTHRFSCSIYDQETGGIALWTEIQETRTAGGAFNLILGKSVPVALVFDKKHWLGVKVNDDPELPRIELTSVPYAIRSRLAESVQDESVTSAQIVDGTVGEGDLANDAVTSAKVKDGELVDADISSSAAISVTKISGLGSAATRDVGTGADQVVQLDGSAKLPAVDGSALTNVAVSSIAANAVTSAQIADGTVGEGDLADNAVTSVKIADGTIAAADLVDGGVTSVKIAADAVTSAQIIDGTIAAGDVGSGQVMKSLNGLKDDVTLAAGSNVTIIPSGNTLTIAASGGGSLADGAVTSVKISDGTITSVDLGINAVGATHLQDAAIGTAKLADGAVTTTQIADGTIAVADLADGAVTSVKIADGTIAAGDMGSGQVMKSLNALKDDVTLAAGTNVTITPSGNTLTIASSGGSLADGAVTSAKIADGTVAVADLADGAVTSAKITDGTITSVDLGINAVEATHLQDAAIGTAKLADGAVTSAKITDGTIAAGDVGSGQVVKSLNALKDDVTLAAGSNVTITPSGNTLTIAASGGNLADGAVTSVKIAADAVTSAQIIDGTIAAADLADGAVTSAKIVNGTIAAADLAVNAVATTHVQDAAISTAKLSADAVTSAQIADGTIAAADVGSGQVVKSFNALKDDVTLAAGSNVTITPSGNTLTIAASSGGNTLDESYDQGGAGAGRTITADNGALAIAGTDGLVATGTYGSGTIPATGVGTRLMWYPKKAAFRAGNVNGAEWDDANIGDYSTVPGGDANTAAGDYGFAVGRRAKANHSGTFVWGDATDADFASTGVNQFLIRASGGVGINTTSPATVFSVAGTIHSSSGGYKFPDGSVQTTAGGGGGNTLDGSYDQGGAGAGRMITADNGAVSIAGTDGLLATGTFGSGTIAATGAGTRLMWYPKKGAFRVGVVTGTHWDDASIGDKSAVSGGEDNTASGEYATIAGGLSNLASGNRSAIGGGSANIANQTYAAVAGGSNNTANGQGSAIGGGGTNSAAGANATIPGGANNNADGDYSFAAGRRAKANHNGAFVWGDQTDADFASTAANQFLIRASGGVGINTTSPTTVFSVAGTIHSSSGGYKFPDGSVQTTAGGGGGSTLDGAYDQGGAGAGRTITADNGAVAVAGTDGLVATGTYGSGTIPTTGAGTRLMWYPKKAAFRVGQVDGTQWVDGSIGNFSTVGGGFNNIASGADATVSGGSGNTASGGQSTVGGGWNNTASGYRSAVPGGRGNWASGDYSFAAGRNAKANHAGAFVWGDQTDADFASTAADQFLIRASGGVGINTTSPTTVFSVAGTVHSTSGGYKFPDGSVQTTASSGGGNTLDGAYDQGGAGAGRTIIADAAAVAIAGTEGLVVTGTFASGGAVPATGAGTRLMWYPKKAAFRAGHVDGTQWDDGNIGGYSTAGGRNNTASGDRTTVAGGDGNTASGTYATVGGGAESTASGNYATIPGGRLNAATAHSSFAAGWRAKANHAGAFVWGDQTDADFASTAADQFLIRASGGVGINTTSPTTVFSVAGTIHSSSGGYKFPDGSVQTTAGGGGGSTLDGAYDQGGAGAGRTITADNGAVAVAGTDGLVASGTFGSGTIPATGAGTRLMWYPKKAAFRAGFVNGVQWDDASIGNYSTVAGGENNTASGLYATVGGGWGNTASNTYATVGGGSGNTASVQYATVPGGVQNAATGDFSFAAGRRAKANHNGAFVWGDQTDADFASTAADQFLIRASGGVGIGTTSPGNHLHITASVEGGGVRVEGAGANSPAFQLYDGGTHKGTLALATEAGDFSTSANVGDIVLRADNNLILGTQNPLYTARMLIASSGNVGIGTTSPGQQLTVAGTVESTSGGFKFPDGTTQTTAASGGNTLDQAYDQGGAGAGGTITADNGAVSIAGTDGLVSSGTVGSGTIPATGAGTRLMWYPKKAAFRAGNVSGTQWDDGSIGNYSTVAGGVDNTASGQYATVAGGWGNTVTNLRATVGGGGSNTAGGDYATIAGGNGNTANGNTATVGGGNANTAAGDYGTVPGGRTNSASNSYGAVGGGQNNTASGQWATIPGGRLNAATGNYSFAVGQRAKANHAGTFVWADQTAADFASTAVDQFLIRASGGVGINTASPTAVFSVAGTIHSTANGYKFPDGSVQTTAASAGGNTLDGAYDQGGAGAGRAITADNGAVSIAGTDGLVSSGTYGSGTIPTTGAGTRLMWYPKKAAFRAGRVNGTHWDDGSIGNQSTVAGGYNNTASGAEAFIGGGNTNTASGLYATVGGGLGNSASNESATVGGGDGNMASVKRATIGGGFKNAASGLSAVISGGESSTASNTYAAIGGGGGHTASGVAAVISGGYNNTASGLHATVAGGNGNTASNMDATVGGGTGNSASGQQATVSGGGGNNATVISATVGGGAANTASGGQGTVGGGGGNTASGMNATVPGGKDNTAGGDYSFAVGRRAKANHAGTFVWGDQTDADFASTAVDQFLIRASGGVGINTTSPTTVFSVAGTVHSTSGGYKFPDGSVQTTAASGGNTLDGAYDQGGAGAGRTITADNGAVAVAGTDGLVASGTYGSGTIPTTGAGTRLMWYPKKGAFRAGRVNGTQWDDSNVGNQSTVAGGYNNTASGAEAFIGGGDTNTASGSGATIGGGISNTASGTAASTVGGGNNNTASGSSGATVGGGSINTASGNVTTVGGGSINTASGNESTVSGGQSNTASGVGAVISGGNSSGAYGQYSTIPGGSKNKAVGDYSFAAGRRAKANHNGTFVWADQTAADFASTAVDQFLIRASGGVGIGTTSPGAVFSVVASSTTVASFNRTATDGTIISLQQDGVEEGTISVATTTVSYNAFTGSHYAWTDWTIERGTLVSLTGVNRHLHDDSDAEIVYGVVPSAVPNDPRVMGAYLSLQDAGEPEGPDNPHLVMAVGNGEAWVVDDGEDIAIGDYLIAADVHGHAMKDQGKYEISYVVARAAEPVQWDGVGETVAGRKHRRISVFFESFARGHSLEKIEALQTENRELRKSNERLEAQMARLAEKVAGLSGTEDELQQTRTRLEELQGQMTDLATAMRQLQADKSRTGEVGRAGGESEILAEAR